jgi:hypothetical protein
MRDEPGDMDGTKLNQMRKPDGSVPARHGTKRPVEPSSRSSTLYRERTLEEQSLCRLLAEKSRISGSKRDGMQHTFKGERLQVSERWRLGVKD